MNKKTVIVLADGFEEIEAITPIDVLRRCGVEITVAGLDGISVTGAHGVEFQADCELRTVKAENIGMLILPGGMPGAQHLHDSGMVVEMVRDVYAGGGYVAAICAAPIVLGRAGILTGKQVTAYPGFESRLGGAAYTGNVTEIDGRIITGKGPGASFAFSRRLAEALGKQQAIKTVYEQMFVRS